VHIIFLVTVDALTTQTRELPSLRMTLHTLKGEMHTRKSEVLMEVFGCLPSLFRVTARTLTTKVTIVSIFVAGTALSRQRLVLDHGHKTFELLDSIGTFLLVAFRTFHINVFPQQRIT